MEIQQMMKGVFIFTIAVWPLLSFAEEPIIRRHEFGEVVVEISGINKTLGERDLVLPLITEPDPVTGEHLDSDETIVLKVTDMVSTRTISVIRKSDC